MSPPIACCSVPSLPGAVTKDTQSPLTTIPLLMEVGKPTSNTPSILKDSENITAIAINIKTILKMMDLVACEAKRGRENQRTKEK